MLYICGVSFNIRERVSPDKNLSGVGLGAKLKLLKTALWEQECMGSSPLRCLRVHVAAWKSLLSNVT